MLDSRGYRHLYYSLAKPASSPSLRETPMDYLLENLGPDRFQELCQSLLLIEHPDVQCFPVSQPDGGRDAVSYIPESQTGQFIIFQVKFARRPHVEMEPHKWLLG